LIDDLIELPRLGTGDLPFTPVPMNYVDIVREVVQDLSSLHARQLITLTAPPTVPMEGDPRLLRQVLVNLIDNAVTHGPPGTSVHLSVEIRGERVLTSVSDAGPPIPDEQRARIFEPFHRLETLSRQRSLGIGLAISKGVIEAHRGHIWVADEDHACFVFSLPYTHPENHEARPHKDEVGS
jgi:signal transduction histidine kinase